MAELPQELLAKPLALIALTGLELSNTTHRSIWDAFHSNRRPDSVSVHFKHLPLNPTFPTPKPKRNSYEWYIPKGILKRNWMPKYLSEVPSVVVCFYELDWTDANWAERKMDCASRVQTIRTALDGRSTRIAVVLIQKNLPLPQDSEDTVATERATALCTACELPAKSLYILPHGDHLLGFTSRLETAFYDLAQGFYHHEYRLVKSHKDQLNKTSHQYLFVRHQFKTAFLNELRQERSIALKHYQAAYSNLLEIRMVDTNTYEIKTVASFVNYKICRLMFALNQPRDAISQFRAHTDRFRSRTGPEELIFEHHAFMANQYATFAELFDEAIRQGLPAVQTQHPGYYFQTAATHAGLRQATCREICGNSGPVEPDPLADESKLEFYGQRPWRPGKLSAEPADTLKEAQGIQALKWRERNVNHSMIIIGLLGNAISQFKMYRCPRMRRLLAVQMAAEYYNCRDYGKVLTLLTHMLWEYRSEKWPLLLTDVLQNAMRAAFLNASVQDYLTLGIEALGPATTFPAVQRSRIYANVLRILDRKTPDPEPELPEDAVKEAIEKWNSELGRLDDFATAIEDSNLATFVQVKGTFAAPKFPASGTVEVDVVVRNLFEDTVEFSQIFVTISSPGVNAEVAAEVPAEERGLRFEGREMRKFRCSFPTPAVPDGTEIQIASVSLVLGNEKRRVLMKFPGDPGVLDAQGARGSFEGIRTTLTAQVRHEEAPLEVQVTSQGPGLLSEWLPLKLEIRPREEVTEFSIEVKQVHADHAVDSTTELSTTMTDREGAVLFEEPQIAANEVLSKSVFMRSHQVGVRNFVARIEFQGMDGLRRVREVTHAVEIVKPFDVETQFYSKRFEPLTRAFVEEPLVVMPHIVCTSPWPLTVVGTAVELGHALREEGSPAGTLDNLRIAEGETATDVLCVVPKAASEQPTSTGVYTIRWRREGDGIETSTSVTLAPIWVEDAPVGVEAKIPAHGWVRTPMCVSYYLKNRSDYLITLKMSMEASDAFMFAGQKQVSVYLRPHNDRKVEWILRPLVAGFVALPTLSLSVPAEEEYKLNKNRLAEVLERSLPTHIYVMPKSLTSEELVG